MITVLIVDDHPSFRSFARELLEGAGFDVIGEAVDGESGLRAALSLRPEAILMDVQLPDASGFEITRRLLTEVITRVVLVSTRDESDYGDDMESSGAVGFVPKAELSGARVHQLVGEPVNDQSARPSADNSGVPILEERSR
jgi:DNA-binding NarL/FixJ family response regulator